MSAYVVSNKTIDSILTMASNEAIDIYHKKFIEHILFKTNDANQMPNSYNLSIDSLKTHIGQELLKENVKSVAQLYGGDIQPIWEAYQYKPLSLEWPHSYFQALKSLACLIYQSCERDDWEKSGAFHLTNLLKDIIIQNNPGYDAASWGL